MKDKIVKIALLWTGIFILLFWMMVQESCRVEYQEKITSLEKKILEFQTKYEEFGLANLNQYIIIDKKYIIRPNEWE